MKSSLIFLNGYYDHRYPEFYRREIAWGLGNGYPLICADGGIRLFDKLNQTGGTQFAPDVLIGDLDSVDGTTQKLYQSRTHIVPEWVGQVDKDYTDGQLAVAYAIEEFDCQRIIIYGGLPQPHGYETDHFLGNLKLMRFGLRLFSQQHTASGRLPPYTAEMRDVLQTIHFVISTLRLKRKNEGVQRVSLIAEHPNVRVSGSENLRWDLTGMHVEPDSVNTLRNEFATEATDATIQLATNSDSVYIIHNWYET